MIIKLIKNKNVGDEVWLKMAGEKVLKHSSEMLRINRRRGVPAGRAAPAGASGTLYW